MQQATVSFCNTVWRLAAINLMAIALVVAGFGLFGLGPAITASLWAVSRHGDRSVRQLIVGMGREWRVEFLRANLALLPPVGILAAMLAILPYGHSAALAAAIAVSVLALAFMLATLYVVSQVHCDLRATLGNALRLCAVSPLRLLGSVAIVAMLCIIALSQPLFGLYGLFAVSARVSIALLGAPRLPARPSFSLDSRPQENPA